MNVIMVSCIIIVVLLLLITIMEFNGMKRAQLKVSQSKSSIDVYLKERFDLIPNLVNVVKGYTKYEQELLQSIVQIRNEYEKTRKFEIRSKFR